VLLLQDVSKGLLEVVNWHALRCTLLTAAKRHHQLGVVVTSSQTAHSMLLFLTAFDGHH
jgi:hypothetical protein